VQTQAPVVPPTDSPLRLQLTSVSLQSSTQFGYPPDPVAHDWQRVPANPNLHVHRHSGFVGVYDTAFSTAVAAPLQLVLMDVQSSTHWGNPLYPLAHASQRSPVTRAEAHEQRHVPLVVLRDTCVAGPTQLTLGTTQASAQFGKPVKPRVQVPHLVVALYPGRHVHAHEDEVPVALSARPLQLTLATVQSGTQFGNPV
jgi:hypothetical protein